jgi:transcriptional regulator with XRE-family HTH domain
MDLMHPLSTEPIGKRIARLRTERGWTQQALAARLAISRVAISHIEMDLTFPSERTVILLAGLFKLSPLALVDGTTYPQAKIDRLPQSALCFSKLELDLAKMQIDLEWLETLAAQPDFPRHLKRVMETWTTCLDHYSKQDLDEYEQVLLSSARRELKRLGESHP